MGKKRQAKRNRKWYLKRILREIDREPLARPLPTGKAAVPFLAKGYPQPDMIRKAVAEAIAPFVQQITQQGKRAGDQVRDVRALALADDPYDPAYEPLPGMMLPPVRKSAPALLTAQEHAAVRWLEHARQVSDNPAERENAAAEISKMRGL